MVKRVIIIFFLSLAYVHGVIAMQSRGTSPSIVHNELVEIEVNDRSKKNFKKKQDTKESKRRQQRKSVSFSSHEYLNSSPNLNSSATTSNLNSSAKTSELSPRAPDSPTTQLVCAIFERNIQSASVLLKPLEINRQIAQFNDDTCLHLACREGDSKMVEELLKSEGIDVNIQNKDGDTPLHIAARNKLGEIVYMLIFFPKIMPSISNCTGDTPLHEAAKNATEESFQAFHILLMSPKVDLKSRNHDSHSYKFYIKKNEKIKRIERDLLVIREKMLHSNAGVLHSKMG